jgi:hypothetical protein
MKHRVAALCLVMLGALSIPSAASARATVEVSVSSGLLGLILPSECAGEPIEFTGESRNVLVFVQSDSGETKLISHTVSNVSGTGLTTGETYRLVSVFSFPDDLSGAPYSATLIQRFHVIGPNRGDNFILDLVAHFTISANGEGHAFVSRFTQECR